MTFLTETEVIISGPVGQIEARFGCSKEDAKPRLLVMCHPHPLMGGTFNNKVVTTVVRTFHQIGFNTLRFNFRGIGKSDGTYADGIGESEDLLAILNWGKQECPGSEVWLAGFSFGAYVSLRVANEIIVDQLITIAPPVHYENLLALPRPSCPWVVVQGDEDEVVSPEKVFEWVEEMTNPPTLIRIQGAGHFFHGHLIDLRDELIKVGSSML